MTDSDKQGRGEMGTMNFLGGADLLRRPVVYFLFVFALLMTGVVPAQAQQADIQRADRLVKEGRAAEAFAILEPLESSNAGDIQFDYLLGIAALDAGKPDRASIAFERVLATDPDFAGARLDLGRAYFAMGSDDLAKEEFESVAKVNPPENVKQIVAKYLDAIEARKKRDLPVLATYVEGGGGTDTNISAVTSNFTSAVLQAYNLANVQPTGNSLRRQGSFSNAGVGTEYTHPSLDYPGLAYYVGADARERRYYDNNAAFSSQQLDFRGGVSWQVDANLFKAGVQDQHYFQEGSAPASTEGTAVNNDRKTFGYTFEYRRALPGNMQLGAFLQLNEQRFATNNTQDVNQNLYGLQWIKALDMPWKPLLFATAFLSRDRALRPQNTAGTTDVSKTITGLRGYAQVTPYEHIDFYGSLGHTERDDNAMFSRSTVLGYGKDRTFDVTLGLNWRFMPSWVLRFQGTTTENRSNLSLYEYKRTEYIVNIRRDFK